MIREGRRRLRHIDPAICICIDIDIDIDIDIEVMGLRQRESPNGSRFEKRIESTFAL